MDNQFGGTTTNRYIYFLFDPDGQTNYAIDGPGKTLIIDIYYNGRINTSTERQVGDLTNHGGPDTIWGSDPPPSWFNW